MKDENTIGEASVDETNEGPFKTVWRGYDAAQGQMLEELLRQEGFEARLIGTRTPALIGVGQFTAELRLEVAHASAEEAERVLDEFRHSPLSEESDDTEGEDA